MAQFLFVSWNGGGNLPPMFRVAAVLRGLGHAVDFAGQELGAPDEPGGYDSMAVRCDARGLRFLPLPRSAAKWEAEPPERRIVTGMMACTEHGADLADVVRQRDYDVLVIDCLMFGALTAAASTGTPVSAFVHSAPGALMAPGGHLETWLLSAVNELRSTAGRQPVERLWDVWSESSTLCTSLRALDPLGDEAPDSFSYVGPVFESEPASGWQSPWESDDTRPMVLVSFTTNPAWEQSSRIRRTLAALDGVQYRVLVTASLADLGDVALPANAVVVRHIPHAEVLPVVAAAVVHAGHGTITACLAHGVPVISLPNPAADQPPLAARVQALGAGRALDGESATPTQIRDAVDQVTTEGSYRAAATALKRSIAAADSDQLAGALLERLLDPAQ